MALIGNHAGVPGEDDYRRGQVNEHLRTLDAEQVWDERVETRAQELQSEDPDLDDEEAQDFAGEQLRKEDREAAERYWDSVAYERGMG